MSSSDPQNNTPISTPTTQQIISIPKQQESEEWEVLDIQPGSYMEDSTREKSTEESTAVESNRHQEEVQETSKVSTHPENDVPAADVDESSLGSVTLADEKAHATIETTPIRIHNEFPADAPSNPRDIENEEEAISTDESVSIEDDTETPALETPQFDQDSETGDRTTVSHTIFDSSSPENGHGENLQSKLDASDFVQDKMMSSQDSITVSIDSKEDMEEKISSSLQREHPGSAALEEEDYSFSSAPTPSEDKQQREQQDAESTQSGDTSSKNAQQVENDYDSRNVTVDSSSLLDPNEDELIPMSPTLAGDNITIDGDINSEHTFDNNTLDDIVSLSSQQLDETSRRISEAVQNAVSQLEVQDFVKQRLEKAVEAEAPQERTPLGSVTASSPSQSGEQASQFKPKVAAPCFTDAPKQTSSSAPVASTPLSSPQRRSSVVNEVTAAAETKIPASTPPSSPEVDRTSTRATRKTTPTAARTTPATTLRILAQQQEDHNDHPLLSTLDILFNPASPRFNLVCSTLLIFVFYVIFNFLWSGGGSVGATSAATAGSGAV
mmetsp:Transcript_5410/g.20195  ORF Transcript_5410/g.20195 Transcript_5410/m.20195 type:complete len:554 (-) Transcript_5410:232-1893(-)|eukprot:CAMPEP_0117450658 /NCGR_PEP_ID=MMETSP0759-20121206/8587_1 /TAXON_ID=63605 /ORGANISM="Percolomonas cosmopolitus, Strain WS" /LENGTH=553 /DNA_ID=CAMNT_0005243197 /DNA_START=540 /DNA_END=2201 /DNA_ORIENTATION=+